MLARNDVLPLRLKPNIITLRPRAELLQARRRLVGQLADDDGVKEGLDLDGPRQVELLSLGL